METSWGHDINNGNLMKHWEFTLPSGYFTVCNGNCDPFVGDKTDDVHKFR